MAATQSTPLVEVRDLVEHFGSVIALNGVSMKVHASEVLCLLGDNGAGKSTLIKTLAGVHKRTTGDFLVEGKTIDFESPRDALDAGIATVYQDLAMIPLMSITRNFFMGREPMKGVGPFRYMDMKHADAVTREEMHKIGIDIRDPQQAVGTLSGGERQCVAIARARCDDLSFNDGVRAGMFTVPGDGGVDFTPLAHFVRDGGYRGWLIVEAEQDPERAPPAAVTAHAFEYLDQVLRPKAGQL